MVCCWAGAGKRPVSPYLKERGDVRCHPRCIWAWLFGSRSLPGFRDGIFRLDLVPDPDNFTVGVNQERGADDPLHLFAIHRLFAPGAVGQCDDMIRIGQQRKTQTVFAVKFLLGRGFVGG
jgi:hypothetical protein